MSKQSSERRSYSVDEMMDKLREGQREKREQEESELVTRPDGSQVVRVRRRKRRSNQPHKIRETRRKRTGLVLLIAGAVVLVVAAATFMILLARFNSKGYRDELKERILASTGAQAGIEDLSVRPFRAEAGSMELQWSDGGVVRSLKLRGLSAPLEVTSFAGADWNGEAVNIDSGRLMLGPPDPSRAGRISDADFPFNYDSFRCGNVDILYGEDVERPPLRVTGSEVTLRPHKKGGAQFIINGGRARLNGGQELRVGRGLAELEEDRFRIVSLRISPPEGASGEAVLRTAKPIRATGPVDLEFELTNYSLAHLLGGPTTGLGQLFGGVVETGRDAPGTVVIDPQLPAAASVEVAFTGLHGTLKNLMFLRVLGGIFRNSDYNEPESGTISGVFKRDQDGTRLHDFTYESKALLKLQGNIDLANDGELSGKLRVGVPQGLFLTASLERYHTMFSPPELGYRWVQVSLFGTVERPLDDFGRIVEEAVAPTEARPAADELLEDVFRKLTEDPEEE